MPFHTQTLSNGLQILGETSNSALSVAVGFFVRTGARDEVDGESGVSHFLEHMVFKGTERRTAWDVNRDFDRIGADNNAFTSEENTVFHATVLPEYLPDAVDILTDMLRPALRKDDFETEKGVIQDEIVRYEVQPGWAAYDNSKRVFFGKHTLGQSILGTKESIAALSREQMYDYFRRRYVAPNILAVAAGRFDWPKFVQLIERHCGEWESGSVGRKGLDEAKGAGGLHVLTRPKVMQEYVMLWAPAPTADAPLRHAAHILTTALGDYTGSRLFWALVDPGLADSADMGFYEYEGAGAYITSFSCQAGVAHENRGRVLDVFTDVQKNNITNQELQLARTKSASREVRGSERTFRRMLDIGRDWTYLHQYRTLDDELAAIDAVSLATVRELLDRYPLNRLTTVALGPLETL
ncbi:MAG TPA: pitrilysin family protein [Gemmataceae bacterium]|jgi:predicted Zn-dependent peptidase|nr:pitrilysin family protein [Gemmataceae bacterium]